MPQVGPREVIARDAQADSATPRRACQTCSCPKWPIPRPAAAHRSCAARD